MKANELRIGNIIQYQSSLGKTYMEVESINSDGIDLFVDDYYPHNLRCDLSYKDIEPIPLSEEILLKCGFEKDIHGDYLNRGMELGLKNGMFNFRYGLHHFIAIDSLHQLQNLYFALCGQELNTSGL